MNSLWPKFTKDHPCPGCGHWDWSCRQGERAFIGMRVESAMPSRDGGWYHFYEDKKKLRLLPLPPRPRGPVTINAPEIAEQCQAEIQPAEIESLASTLGVSYFALEQLGVGWFKQSAYAFPMCNGQGMTVGVHLRSPNGEKRAVTGSRNGLFIPDRDIDQTVFLPEGMSNTAALITMGFYAIGRPSCNTGGEMLKEYLRLRGIYNVVIVADNDEIKGTGVRPGIDGAKKLKKELAIRSCIWIPPSPLKDVRQLLNKAGREKATLIIKAMLTQQIWTR